MAEQPAAQVALKLGANEARQFTAGIALLRFGEEGSQIFADDAMEQSLFGLATLVADPRTDRRAEPRGLFCGTRAHQPPPSTEGARLPPRYSASATRNHGELWSSDLPDSVCVSDTARGLPLVRTPGRAGCLENIRITSQCTLCDGNAPKRGVCFRGVPLHHRCNALSLAFFSNRALTRRLMGSGRATCPARSRGQRQPRTHLPPCPARRLGQ